MDDVGVRAVVVESFGVEDVPDEAGDSSEPEL